MASPGRHASCHEISYSKRETKLKKEKNNKFSPLCPLNCRFGHRRTSTFQRLYIFCGNPQLWHPVKVRGSSPGLRPMHFPSGTPAIHSYLTPFSLLAWHPNLFSLNSPSRYKSISSAANPLNDYQLTLLHRLSWQYFPSPSCPHGQTTGARLHQSFHLYPSSLRNSPCIQDPIHPPNT